MIIDKMRFIDTHVHLYDEAFDEDFDSVVERMKNEGVIACILPGIDKESFDKENECAKKCEGFAKVALGLHPTSVKENYKEELNFALEKLYAASKTNNKFVAVGEIGLDAYWSRDFMEEQLYCFKEQMLAAAELDLPVIIHTREATDYLFDALDSLKGIKQRGVFHAYSGSYEMYERIKKYGDYLVGIGGVVTYKKASIADTLERIPLDRILLETDAPWLTPVPFRGKRNESSYLPYIAAKIADIKNVNISDVAEQTTKNAISLFRLNF